LKIASIFFHLKDNKPLVLITGSGGQLGQSFRLIENNYSGYHFSFVDRVQLAIEDTEALADFFNLHNVGYCINCAAYTAVDNAETDTATAFSVNAGAAANLAATCRKYGSAFIHISTDYVFDGKGIVPYSETAITSPVNAYGASKLKGEQLIVAANPESVIIRTSWLYSPFGHNFVKTMMRLMGSRESINVVGDQLGRPTYAPDLATAIMQMIDGHNLKAGIYHFSNTGEAISWFDFAVAIKEFTGSSCVVHPIDTTAYPTPARRPAYSVLSTSLIQQQYSLDIPNWKHSLQSCVQILLEAHN
jgi:dTDP-4-dehydrorhamnose reductase